MQVDSHRKLRWLVLVAMSSLAVAAVVLWILGRQPSGDATGLEKIEGPATTRIVAFGFYGTATTTLLAELRDLLPAGVALAAQLAMPQDLAISPASLGDVDVRWASVHSVRTQAERYGFDATAVADLGPDRPTLLLAVLDRDGRVRGRYVADPSPGGAWADPVVAQASWLASLEARPLLHAALNATSALLLVVGYGMIRSRRVAAHLTCMILAALVTTAFLISYLYYHYHAGSVAFTGSGWSRPLYFTVLLTHVTLAALVVPLVVTLLYHAIRRRFTRHRRLARWALPIWLYVSVTGVLIYWMLYRWPT
jgi:uncharacterized membrane protein YozB (DUF420 family)